jgi:hypothetical protein
MKLSTFVSCRGPPWDSPRRVSSFRREYIETKSTCRWLCPVRGVFGVIASASGQSSARYWAQFLPPPSLKRPSRLRCFGLRLWLWLSRDVRSSLRRRSGLGLLSALLFLLRGNLVVEFDLALMGLLH